MFSLETERNRMENEITQKILEYNYKVKGESKLLEEMGKSELIGIREEIDKETKERISNDKELLGKV
mgnify:CR=1 FL=1